MSKAFLISLTIVLTSLNVWGDSLSGDSLNIGSGGANDNTVSGAQSAAIGGSNTVDGGLSLAIGEANYIAGGRALTLGWNNYILGDGTAIFGGDNESDDIVSLISGSGNYVFSDNVNGIGGSSLYVGNNNIGSGNIGVAVLGGINSASASLYSIVGGEGNTVDNITGGVVIGSVNLVSGTQYVIGKGLVANDATQASTIIGQYNNYTPPVGKKFLFVVGNGSSSTPNSNRKNALEIFYDGGVVIPKRQGDVGMGRFGYTVDQ